LRIGVVQCALGRASRSENVDEVARLIRLAAELGAQIILPPELFEGPYFCQQELPEHFDLAHPMDAHPTVERMQALAAELGVVIPVSVFEQDKQSYYNTVAMVDADGACWARTARATSPTARATRRSSSSGRATRA
jgi:predicted amidohydrolase